MKLGLAIALAVSILTGCASSPRSTVAPVAPVQPQLAIDCENSLKRCYDQATITCNGDWHISGQGDFQGTEGRYRMYVRCGGN